jgi:hypothetical protein
MHYCGVIIIVKNMKLEDARNTLGEVLVNYRKADWYSVDGYRERLFPGETKDAPKRQRITLTEFKENFKHWAWNASAFTVIGKKHYIDEVLYKNEFYEFYNMEGRQELIDLYNKLYKQRIAQIIDFLDESEYDVVLLDYHN